MTSPLCPSGKSGAEHPVSILNFQGKLNAARSLSTVKSSEPAGKHAGATWRASWNEGAAPQVSVTYLEDMAIEDVEKRCLEVNCRPLTEKPGFFAEREVFVLGGEPPGSG